MVLSLIFGLALTSVHDYWKNHSFDYTDFASKVVSLFFNMLFRFVIAILPRSRRHLILWLQSPSTLNLEPKKMKSVTASIISPCICHEMMGLDARSLSLNVEF